MPTGSVSCSFRSGHAIRWQLKRKVIPMKEYIVTSDFKVLAWMRDFPIMPAISCTLPIGTRVFELSEPCQSERRSIDFRWPVSGDSFDTMRATATEDEVLSHTMAADNED